MTVQDKELMNQAQKLLRSNRIYFCKGDMSYKASPTLLAIINSQAVIFVIGKTLPKQTTLDIIRNGGMIFTPKSLDEVNDILQKLIRR